MLIVKISQIKNSQKEGGGSLTAKLWLYILPCVYDSESPGLHAVDRPVCDSLRVADADGESAVVGSDQIDSRALLALDFKRRAFAPIFG